MFREKCKVLENRAVAPSHFVIKMRALRISGEAKPGQFVQILCEDSYEPLLPRPFSFLTAAAEDFEVLYQVVGKGTKLLSQAKTGDALWVVGPLGNGFTLVKGQEYCVLVGGGVGIPPLYHLAETMVKGSRRLRKNIYVFLGARSKEFLLCEKDFKRLGVNLDLATDNGSSGRKGFVTDVLKDFLTSPGPQTPDPRLYACGPTPMLKAVSLLSQKYRVPCEVSVEVPMACGFGACLGCAIKVRNGRDYRFAVACTEGPVFQAADILWD
jgi:dihydroorotate dehydrogenase electron transfer subunit